MKENDKHWYPIRVTYSQEMKVKSYFDACQIASFIPMRYSEIQRNGQSKIKLVPVIHNLVFVYCTKNEIEQIKRESSISSKIRYIIDKETKQIITIPDKQMQDFISVAGNMAYNHKVITSPFFRICVENSQQGKSNILLMYVVKTYNYYLIWIFQKLLVLIK